MLRSFDYAARSAVMNSAPSARRRSRLGLGPALAGARGELSSKGTPRGARGPIPTPTTRSTPGRSSSSSPREGPLRDPLRAGQPPGLGRYSHRGHPGSPGRTGRGGGVLRYEDAILSVVAGDHPDPFSFLGMHRSEDGFVVRAFLPGASAVEVVSDSGEVLGALDPVRTGSSPAQSRGWCHTGSGSRGRGTEKLRSRTLTVSPRFSASRTSTSSARAATSGSTRSSERDGARRRRRRELRRLGAERAARLGDRGVQPVGWTAARYAQAPGDWGVEIFIPRSARAPYTSTRS